MYQDHNFGMLRVEGKPNQRVLVMENYNRQGKLLWKHSVKASELKIPTLPQH